METGDRGSLASVGWSTKGQREERGNSAGVELERIVLSPGLHTSDGVFSEFWALSLFVTNCIYATG